MIHAKLSLRGQPEFERILLGKKGALSMKTEKEKEEDLKQIEKISEEERQNVIAVRQSIFRWRPSQFHFSELL